MKKILLLFLIILLTVLLFVTFRSGISFAFISVDGWEEIVNVNRELDGKFAEASRLTNYEHPERTRQLNAAIVTLRQVRERYEDMMRLLGSEDVDLRATQIEQYRIDFLWTTLGNYARREGLTLTLELIAGQFPGLYNLEFSLRGEYIGIVNFLYHIENDERLRFRIENFVIAPRIGGTTNQEEEEENTGRPDRLSHEATDVIEEHAPQRNNDTTTTEEEDDGLLDAVFRVRDIGIWFNDMY